MKNRSFTRRERAYLLALKDFARRNFKGRQGELAAAGQISPGYLSEMLGFKKICVPNKREQLARAAAPGLTYDQFITHGLALAAAGDQPRTTNDNITRLDDMTKKRHHLVIEKFKNKELALELNEYMVILEQYAPGKLQEMRIRMQSWIEMIPKKQDPASGE